MFLFFQDEPKELIAVEYSTVRYVYNPKIRSEILDGLSPELSDEEQKRIRNRIQSLLISFQCMEGKDES